MARPLFGFNAINAGLSITGDPLSSQTSRVDGESVIVMWELVATTANAITKVRFPAWATGACPTYRVSLQALDSDGHPTGTVLGGGSPASANFSTADTSVAIQEITLSNSYTPSVGDRFAVVIDWVSGTVGFSDCINVVSAPNAAIIPIGYFEIYQFGGWGRTRGIHACHAVTASEQYGGVLGKFTGVDSFSVPTKETTTSGNRVAAKIVLPTLDYIASYKVCGLQMAALRGFGADTVKYGIWNAAGTVLVSKDVKKTDNDNGIITVEFDTPLSVAPGDTIYAGLESVSSSSAKFGVIDFANTTDRNYSLPSQGNFIYSGWNGSAWTDSATDVPLLQLLVSEITGVDIPTEAEVAAAVWAYAERTLTS